jgi:hypothetical protein
MIATPQKTVLYPVPCHRSLAVGASLILAPLAALGAAPPVASPAAKPATLAWPEVNRPETRPWTWWWWHGSAVTKADITANLEAMQRSGIGGVSIVCLLDVRDEQAVKLRYLSKEWIEAVAHAVREAHRLGMDADMSPVPGWALGGPWVTRDDACALVDVARLSLADCQKNGMRIASFAKDTPGTPERRDLAAVMAQAADGTMADVTAQVDDEGILHWAAPPGSWTLYTAMARVGSSRVRMPTPDGDGWVVDHLSAKSVKRYFEPFDKAFAQVERGDLPRAFNNDSWEIHLNWTPGLLGEFAERRGYDLRQQLPAFAGQGSPDLVSRVACDYRQTVSDLMLDAFTKTFRQWAQSHGRQIVGEAIFEPGNELDINALYDIPQVDMGGPPSWHFPNGNYSTYHLFRRGKTAASPAHILGKPLIASETLTVMGPILDTPLELAKEKIDYDLVGGINHTMFHGITYSPASARWPGWLFYAGTHLGPFNPMWRQGKAFCDYVTRCQSFLQAGRPDADVLVYFPIFDLWSQRQPGNVSPPGTIPPTDTDDYPGPAAAAELWRAGHDFDFTSDKLLESLRVVDARLVAPGASYRALVVSGCRLMAVETLERIVKLVADGATVILHGPLPTDVPGLGQLDQRRARFQAALARIELARKAAGGAGQLGKGRLVFGDNLIAAVAQSGIRREAMTDSGLRYIRRQDTAGTTYFIVNPPKSQRVDGWVPVAANGEAAAIFDPMTGALGVASFRSNKESGNAVRLQLEPSESCIVRVLHAAASGPGWLYLAPAGAPIPLTGRWEVRFLEGGETIPHAETIEQLASWTEWKSDQAAALRAFSGVACYTLRFPTPLTTADAWAIDLGAVCHTARVRLNGKPLGDIFCQPLRVLTRTLAQEGQNLLEIEVANAPINRAADLDIRDIPWQKIMGEDAKSFTIGDFLFPWTKKDATWCPRPSGLLGPVQLIPMQEN